jgi:hypothetical protein
MTRNKSNDGDEGQTESIADGPLPPFAANHDKLVQYSVIRDTYQTRPDRINVQKKTGVPRTAIVVGLIQKANTQGWRLDKHIDHGQELQFVPFEGGDDQ